MAFMRMVFEGMVSSMTVKGGGPVEAVSERLTVKPLSGTSASYSTMTRSCEGAMISATLAVVTAVGDGAAASGEGKGMGCSMGTGTKAGVPCVGAGRAG